MIEHHPAIYLNLRQQDIEQYILNHGWQLVAHPNSKLRVFAGPTDDDGQPIRLALPLADNLRDSPLRLYQAVQTIAAVEDRSIANIVTDITQQVTTFPIPPVIAMTTTLPLVGQHLIENLIGALAQQTIPLPDHTIDQIRQLGQIQTMELGDGIKSFMKSLDHQPLKKSFNDLMSSLLDRGTSEKLPRPTSEHSAALINSFVFVVNAVDIVQAAKETQEVHPPMTSSPSAE